MGNTDREWAMRQHPGLVDSNQIIDLEPEVDLEFKVDSFYFGDDKYPGPEKVKAVISAIKERNKNIEDLLNAGWQIDSQIICPPNVMLIFSREKEEKETEECQQ